MSCYVVRNPNDQNKMLKVYFKKKSRKLPEHTQSWKRDRSVRKQC